MVTMTISDMIIEARSIRSMVDANALKNRIELRELQHALRVKRSVENESERLRQVVVAVSHDQLECFPLRCIMSSKMFEMGPVEAEKCVDNWVRIRQALLQGKSVGDVGLLAVGLLSSEEFQQRLNASVSSREGIS